MPKKSVEIPNHADNLTECSIYAVMEPSVAYRKLILEHNRLCQQKIVPSMLWLLRESRQAGCLTVDYLNVERKVGSYRFALVSESAEAGAKWLKMHDIQVLEKYKSEGKLIFMDMNNYYQQANKSFCNELFSQLEKHGFLVDNYLEPSRQEKSRNIQYVCISKLTFIKHKITTHNTSTLEPELSKMLAEVKSELEQKQQELCPISFNPLQDSNKIAIIPQGEVFENQALVTWLANKPSCPITREPLDTNNVLTSEAPDKTKRKLREIEELVAVSKETQKNNSNKMLKTSR